jgi:hypothetical protein
MHLTGFSRNSTVSSSRRHCPCLGSPVPPIHEPCSQEEGCVPLNPGHAIQGGKQLKGGAQGTSLRGRVGLQVEYRAVKASSWVVKPAPVDHCLSSAVAGLPACLWRWGGAKPDRSIWVVVVKAHTRTGTLTAMKFSRQNLSVHAQPSATATSSCASKAAVAARSAAPLPDPADTAAAAMALANCTSM